MGFLIVVLVTSFWVLWDAKSIGARKGVLNGMFDLGAWGWFFVCLLLWIVGFPAYLFKRGEIKALNQADAPDNPNMIKCSACKEEVSKSAKNCPKCGHKLRSGGFVTFLKYGFIAILVFVGISILLDSQKLIKNNKSANVATDKQRDNSPKVAKVEVEIEKDESFNIKGLFIGQKADDACNLLSKLIGSKTIKSTKKSSTLSELAMYFIIQENNLKIDETKGCAVLDEPGIGGTENYAAIVYANNKNAAVAIGFYNTKRIFGTGLAGRDFAKAFADGYKLGRLEPVQLKNPMINIRGWKSNNGLFIGDKIIAVNGYQTLVSNPWVIMFIKGPAGSFD